MGWFKKKADPISDRARALNEQIAALEAQINQLNAKAAETPAGPKLRSTTVPHGMNVPARAPQTPAPTPAPSEPIFEDVDHKRLQGQGEAPIPPGHFNDLGVRKYDLAGLFKRWQNHFRGPSTTNPKLVNLLAAGSLQGLRPMRYEKRVERNRFLFFAAILLLVLIGILSVVLRK